MRTRQISIAECDDLSGIVVAVDVLRAFTTAAYAFAAGARAIYPAATVKEALDEKERRPGSKIMGEVDGLPVPGFDFSNSPAEIAAHDFSGITLIQRTSAGTQGLIGSASADLLYAVSFPCAEATVRQILEHETDEVVFVVTGRRPNGFGDEDAACADYMAERLCGRHPDPAPYLERVPSSKWGRLFASPDHPDYPAVDLKYCTALDRFDFAMRAEQREGGLVLRPVKS